MRRRFVVGYRNVWTDRLLRNVGNYYRPTPRNIPEEREPQLYRDGRLKSDSLQFVTCGKIGRHGEAERYTLYWQVFTVLASVHCIGKCSLYWQVFTVSTTKIGRHGEAERHTLYWQVFTVSTTKTN
jgi:hypothetical protein